MFKFLKIYIVFEYEKKEYKKETYIKSIIEIFLNISIPLFMLTTANINY